MRTAFFALCLSIFSTHAFSQSTQPAENVEAPTTQAAPLDSKVDDEAQAARQTPAAPKVEALQNAPKPPAPIAQSNEDKKEVSTVNRDARLGAAMWGGIGSALGTAAFVGIVVGTGFLFPDAGGPLPPLNLLTAAMVGAGVAATTTAAGAYYGAGDSLSVGQRVFVASGGLFGHYLGGAAGVTGGLALNNTLFDNNFETAVLSVAAGWTVGAAGGTAIGAWGTTFATQAARRFDAE